MAIKERQHQLQVVAEILLVHIPELIRTDQDLSRDLLSVAGTALHTIFEDAEQSAKSWDKRAYHTRAEEMRQEWGWALGAGNYALGLALQPAPITEATLGKLVRLIRPELSKPARKQIADPKRFRGAAQAVKQQQEHKRNPVRW